MGGGGDFKTAASLMPTVLGSAAGADGDSSFQLTAAYESCSTTARLLPATDSSDVSASLPTFPFFFFLRRFHAFYTNLLYEEINIPGRDRGEQRSRSGGSCRSSPHASRPLWRTPPPASPVFINYKDSNHASCSSAGGCAARTPGCGEAVR